jgi:hypothetical protein
MRVFRFALLIGLVLTGMLASQARAAEWMVGGKTLASAAKSGSETVAGSGPMTFTMGGTLKFECETSTTGSILTGGTGTLSVAFKGCHLPNEICALEPFTVGMSLTLGGAFVQISPGGASFATITFAKTKAEECATPTKTSGDLTGKTAAETDEPGNESIQYPFKFSPAINGLSKVSMRYLTLSATFEGTLNIALSGPNSKLAWGTETTATTKLCKASSGACEPYKLGTALSASLEEGTKEGVKFVFTYKSEKLEPSCLVSTLKGESTNQGSPQVGRVTGLEFSECGGGLCTVSSTGTPWESSVEATTGGNGTLTWRPSFRIKCTGMGEECAYSAEKAVGFSLTGGTPAKLSSAAVPLVGGGKECGTTGAKWEGVAAAGGLIKYKVTSPSPLFVRLL